MASNGGATRYIPARDRETGGFFEAANQHRLVLKFCESCGTVLHLPRSYCSACGSWDTGWREVAGRGTLYSWSVLERQFHPAYPAPFTVLLVDLDDVPARLVGSIAGTPELHAGQPMEAWWDELDNEHVIPNWRPVETAG